MKLAKKIIVLLAGFSCFNSLRAQDTLSKWQMAFGVNYFPAYYFKWLNGYGFSDVFYGYHLGFCKELHKINIRGGVNFNSCHPLTAFKLRSRLLMLCVSEPTEIKSTPDSA